MRSNASFGILLRLIFLITLVLVSTMSAQKAIYAGYTGIASESDITLSNFANEISMYANQQGDKNITKNSESESNLTTELTETHEIIVTPTEPLDGYIVACETNYTTFSVTDESGIGIDPSSIIVSVASGTDLDTFLMDLGNLYYDEEEEVLIFYNIGWRNWVDGELVTVTVENIANHLGTSITEPVSVTFQVDRSAPVITNIYPSNGDSIFVPYPHIEADISDIYSTVNADELEVRINYRRYHVDDGIIFEDGHLIFDSPGEIDEGDELIICVEAEDFTDVCGPNRNTLCSTVYVGPIGPYVANFDPPNGVISSCDCNEVMFELQDIDGINISTFLMTVVYSSDPYDTTYVTSISDGFHYTSSYSGAFISYEFSSPLIDGETATVSIVRATDNDLNPMRPSPITYTHTADYLAPNVVSISPSDCEIVTERNPEIVVELEDNLSGINWDLLEMQVNEENFDLFCDALTRDGNTIIFNPNIASMEIKGGDTVSIVISLTDNATVCVPNTATFNSEFYIESGGPSVMNTRPYECAVSSCEDEYFRFSIADHNGLNLETLEFYVDDELIPPGSISEVIEPSSDIVVFTYCPLYLSEGTHTYNIAYIEDILGNPLDVPHVSAFTIDRRAPELTSLLTIPPSGTLYEMEPDISFEYYDLSGINLELSTVTMVINDSCYYYTFADDEIIVGDDYFSFDPYSHGVSFSGGDSIEITFSVTDNAISYSDSCDYYDLPCPPSTAVVTINFNLFNIGPTATAIYPPLGAISACVGDSVLFMLESEADVVESSIRIEIYRPEHSIPIDTIITTDSPSLYLNGEYLVYSPNPPLEHNEHIYLSVVNATDNLDNSLISSDSIYYTTDFEAPEIISIYPDDFSYQSTDSLIISVEFNETGTGINEDTILFIMNDRYYWTDDIEVTLTDNMLLFDVSYVCMYWLEDDTISLCAQFMDTPDICDPNIADTCWHFIIDMDNVREHQSHPDGFELFQNSPNPFNNKTLISFKLETDSEVSLDIFNINGNLIDNPISDKFLSKGTHSVKIDASGWRSGVYLYRLSTDNESSTKFMLFTK